MNISRYNVTLHDNLKLAVGSNSEDNYHKFLCGCMTMAVSTWLRTVETVETLQQLMMCDLRTSNTQP
jgi:hypothetical protein